ncbi:hypothetical protein [uncultured Tenacibaculum sp.]|uniref:hypothetical protein n=1 Tax=uncultured Tenacibaculum sp. TaxID=174713 RepID=UPI00261082B7|nr:hypothetical protein [uncultured Tenacibaculum sp.]
MAKNIYFSLFFIAFSVSTLFAQNGDKKQIKNRNNISDSIRPEYVLKIKLKKVPNSKKVVITSIKYEKRQSQIFKLLLAQKERIKELEKKNNVYQQ